MTTWASAVARWATCAGAGGEVGVPYCYCWPCTCTSPWLVVPYCCRPCPATVGHGRACGRAGRALLLLAMHAVAPCPAIADVHRVRGACCVTQYRYMCLLSSPQVCSPGSMRLLKSPHMHYILPCCHGFISSLHLWRPGVFLEKSNTAGSIAVHT